MEGDKKSSKNDYQIIKEIGKGAYGTVYTANEKKTGKILAIKQIDLETDWLPLLSEINMVIGLSHESIVNYFTYFFEESKLWLVMEYCDGGSLSDIMKTLKKPLSEHEVSAVLRSVINSLIYVHSLGRIHRDIKAGNLLVTSKGVVKLCDFGVSAQLDEARQRTGTVVGSPYWMAPEIMNSQKDGLGYDKKVDVWSLGITALELINGNPPYHELPALAVLMKIPTSEPPQAPSNSSTLFKDFIKTTLIKDPEFRPQAKDLLNHQFITQITENKATEIVTDLVSHYLESKSHQNNNDYEYEEEEEGYEEENGYEEEEEGFSLDPNQAQTLLYNDSTFVASTFMAGTMVTESGNQQPSALAGYKPEFLGEPSHNAQKFQQAQKRHFKNFNEKDLNYMLNSVKQLALNNLKEGKIDVFFIKKNYEEVRKLIVQELQKQNPNTYSDDFEKLD